MTTIQNEELVLRVRPDYDPRLIRLELYEAFLDALCGDREFQKDAIKTVCRLLGGGQYGSTRHLAEENFASNASLVEKYGSMAGMASALPFPDRLACSVDLATGTGKSWVMYGVARILLAEGIVDRVLVLCPSLTIEGGLREKFRRLSGDRVLRDLIPDDALYPNPEITDANITTGLGDVCIENIDATYKHVRSSVRDSFAGKGQTTLVLNDETHHVFSPPTREAAIKKWKGFLDSEEFGFARIAGFSGTCYHGDDYFPDVVARYSLRQAMEEGRVKEVYYVAKDESNTQQERFQKWLQVHDENQVRYPTLKPLSIVVTARIEGAQELADEFIRFLADAKGSSVQEMAKHVIVVTSKHPTNVAKLSHVDRADDPIEWIFSVSMLTEGWDVKNVFQIVPHEKRAFNSKLLIAQVLGRGLRIPPDISRPVVRVFNHSSWSSEIGNLVDEVLELERRLYSYPASAGERITYHFDLHHLSYNTHTVEQDLPVKNGDGHVQLFKKGYVSFESQPAELQRQTTFESALTGREFVLKTKIQYPAYAVDEVVQKLRARLKSVDAEGGTKYARDYPPQRLRAVIDASLERIGEKRGLVSEQNLQHALRAIGITQRKMAKTVRIEREPNQLFTVSTKEMRKRSAALTSFRKEATAFYDSDSAALCEDSDRLVLAELTDPSAPYPRSAAIEIANRFWFKSPVNVVLGTHEPERSFVRRLFDPAVADRLAGWVKSPDIGFYEIQFSWRKGEHTKLAKFNPDLFIKLNDTSEVLVVELKDDDDVTDENRAKLRFAVEHFDQINTLQNDVTYRVVFLSPRSYDEFFQAITDGNVGTFVSGLQAALQDENGMTGQPTATKSPPAIDREAPIAKAQRRTRAPKAR